VQNILCFAYFQQIKLGELKKMRYNVKMVSGSVSRELGWGLMFPSLDVVETTSNYDGEENDLAIIEIDESEVEDFEKFLDENESVLVY
jgi:hypothetical protein